MELILASKSPRRLFLLKAAGLTVHSLPAGIDESPLPDETVGCTVERLACAKAAACRSRLLASNDPLHNAPIIAADTLVALDNQPVGQPRDLDHARAMLRALSGKQHQVYSGVCVDYGGQQASDVVITDVRFRPLSDGEIEAYIASHQVLDKAGAYALQEGASAFITLVRGPLDNVIGLPVRRTLDLLAQVVA